MDINFIVVALAALVPLILGFVWYNQNVFGKAWMVETGMTQEKGRAMNMFKVFGLTYLMAFFLAFSMLSIVIHQYGVFSLFIDEPDFNNPTSEAAIYFKDFMTRFGDHFRTFKHGSLHGTLAGIFLVTPIITVNALFEGRSFKYIAIISGFWTVCMGIMGGILCAFN